MSFYFYLAIQLEPRCVTLTFAFAFEDIKI